MALEADLRVRAAEGTTLMLTTRFWHTRKVVESDHKHNMYCRRLSLLRCLWVFFLAPAHVTVQPRQLIEV